MKEGEKYHNAFCPITLITKERTKGNYVIRN